ncbi:YjbF family lipoprotein [Thioclava sp. BHET1]|nr:YjbF family lipoprotein [Thioclava sp. BHET1]
MRQRWILLMLLPALAGCGAILQSSHVSPIEVTSSQGTRFAALERAGAPELQAYLENTKTPTTLRLALATPDGVKTWLSADGAEVVTKDGMLISTRGLVEDLMSSDVSHPAALIHSRRAGQAKRFQSHLNGDHQIIIRAYVCDITPEKHENLQIAGSQVNTLLMHENCLGENGESFDNYYWVDPANGIIRQSLQYISALGGRIALQMVPTGSGR